MNENLKRNITERNTWMRALYMLLFILIYNLVEIVTVAVALLQFVIKLLTGKTNIQLLYFGQSLSVYVYQIWRFLTFNTEALPFPFDRWPQGDKGATQELLGPPGD